MSNMAQVRKKKIAVVQCQGGCRPRRRRLEKAAAAKCLKQNREQSPADGDVWGEEAVQKSAGYRRFI